MSDLELHFPGGVLPLPLASGTEGPSGMDISRLLDETGDGLPH